MSQLTPAEKKEAFLAEVAKGEYASMKVRAEEAAAKKAAQKFPFQGRTFEPSSTFQPQLTRPSRTYSSEPW